MNKEIGMLFLFSVLFGALTVVLHEAGHYLACVYFGYSPVLHYASVSTVETLAPFEAAAVGQAGNIMPLTVAVTALWLMYRVARNDVFVSLGFSMAIRNVILLPLLLLGMLKPEEGVVGYAIVFTTDVMVMGLLVWLSKHRVRTVAVTVIGGLVGGVLWLYGIGPLLLP